MTHSSLPPADPPTEELTAEQIVARPAVDGDLNEEMRQVAKPFAKPTLVLAAVVVLAGVFAGGAWTHAAFGSSTPSTSSARPAGAGTGAAPSGTAGTAGPGGRQGGQRGGGTTGTVERVDGTTVYLKTAQGAEVAVSTTDSTTVGSVQPGKLADLKPGANVTVQGQPGTDGGVTAQAITQEPARAGG